MKRNFDVVMKKFDGQEITRPVAPESKDKPLPMTLKFVCIEALFAQLPGDDQLGGQAKLDLHLLGTRINKGGDVDVTAEELSLLKERVGKAWSALVAGPALLTLDPKEGK